MVDEHSLEKASAACALSHLVEGTMEVRWVAAVFNTIVVGICRIDGGELLALRGSG